MTNEEVYNFAERNKELYYLNCQMWTYSVRKGYIVGVSRAEQEAPYFAIEDAETGETSEFYPCDLYKTVENAQNACKEAQAKCDKQIFPETQNEMIIALAKNGFIK